MLVYDGDCRFCTTAVGEAARRLRRMPAEIVPSQRLDDAALARLGLDRQDVTEAAWVVTPRRRFRGHQTASALLRMQPEAGRRLVGAILALPPFDAIGAAVYRAVAANRHRLPGGTPACELP